MGIAESQAIINAQNQIKELAEAEGLGIEKFMVHQAEEHDGYWVSAKASKIIQRLVPTHLIVEEQK